LVSNIFRNAAVPFSIASPISRSRIDSRASVQSVGAPTMAAIKNCLSATQPPESAFGEGSGCDVHAYARAREGNRQAADAGMMWPSCCASVAAVEK
jgi:hypothetical protein